MGMRSPICGMWISLSELVIKLLSIGNGRLLAVTKQQSSHGCDNPSGRLLEGHDDDDLGPAQTLISGLCLQPLLGSLQAGQTLVIAQDFGPSLQDMVQAV